MRGHSIAKNSEGAEAFTGEMAAAPRLDPRFSRAGRPCHGSMEENMSTLRLGVVGAGFITRFQTLAMKQVRGMEFAGITQHRGSAAVVKLAKDLGVGEPRIYPSLGEMAKNVDCIAI